ncbi:MAG: TrpR-like protein YerC/YecD [Tissierellia bacterium]|nr:TrpR-like protein YerC/YecD [Tissierellia bacterium]
MSDKYGSRIQDERIDRFFKGILSLESMDECYRFFEDICTINEIKSIAQRLEIADLLMKDRTYSEIEEETGVSTATISRIKRALNYGAGGYGIVLERLNAIED